MSTTYEITWDLDVFFKGGSHSEEFQQFLQSLSNQLIQLETTVNEWVIPVNKGDTTLSELLEQLQEVSQQLREASAFVGCLQAQDMYDKKANELNGSVAVLRATFSTIMTTFQSKLTKIENSLWEELLNQEQLRELQFILNEWRQNAKEKLSEEQEALINALSVDGFHGWGNMYDTIVSTITIPFEEDGKVQNLSAGQAANKFAMPDAKKREKLFVEWEKAWDEKGDLFAETLNHLAGFRLEVYRQRGWHDILKEALTYNRMKKETLDVMWEVIANNKQPFVEYMKRKAKILGLDQLGWQDLDAPVGNTNKTYTYQEGAEFILKHFQEFGDVLPEFTKRAFEDRWIEAEDRPGKRPGGFCTSFPVTGQSRIFMTYSGTASNVSTLAHELGHAFHTYVLKDVHPLNRGYAMNVAETASTFAEMIVADAAVRNATNKEEKLALLEDKIQRSVAFFMNIHARFLFETRFYEERKKGIVSKERLNKLMEEAQKEAYSDSLKTYHPLFWASKLHFFITGVPFYNFPYTFGYLFSLGIYAQALKEGKDYEKKYIALLQDTGKMTVEELAKKHLGVDLTQKEFWQAGIDICIQDVEEFLEMTKEM